MGTGPRSCTSRRDGCRKRPDSLSALARFTRQMSHLNCSYRTRGLLGRSTRGAQSTPLPEHGGAKARRRDRMVALSPAICTCVRPCVRPCSRLAGNDCRPVPCMEGQSRPAIDRSATVIAIAHRLPGTYSAHHADMRASLCKRLLGRPLMHGAMLPESPAQAHSEPCKVTIAAIDARQRPPPRRARRCAGSSMRRKHPPASAAHHAFHAIKQAAR